MLGHIAIAAMGGCFSQNPDTGAAEATYFPAESVVIQGVFQHKVSRPAGTTDFTQGFTNTRFWTKQQALSSGGLASYPPFIALGTVATGYGARTWCQCGMGPNSGKDAVLHIVNERILALSTAGIPTNEWICTKNTGSDESRMTDGNIDSRRTSSQYSASLEGADFVFLTGPQRMECITRFWGDLMSNEYYGIHFRRIPMQCVENESVALYEADGKQLVEY